MVENVTKKVTQKYYRFLNVPAGDLRISITDMCNMHCSYCHNEGQEKAIKNMTFEDFVYIVENSIKYGVRKVRLTGGEPLMHPDIERIAQYLKINNNINNCGLNTNGYNRELLIKMCEQRLFDQVVIGLDYFSAPVSKDSPIGPSSEEVLKTVEYLKHIGVNVQITKVYNYDIEEIYNLIEWCFQRKVLLKILEKTDEKNMDSKDYFDNIIDIIINKYNLKLGLTVDLNEYYAYNDAGNKILFFQSHCNRRECETCKNMHLRVMSTGYTKSCLLRDDTSFNLLENFDDAMKKAIVNLGIPPEKEKK